MMTIEQIKADLAELAKTRIGFSNYSRAIAELFKLLEAMLDHIEKLERD